ncbi:MAG: GNAT family N-acetyltransferase [Bacteroidia bacterium]
MQLVRSSVFENKLSEPGKIKDQDYIPFLEQTGRGWVAESGDEIAGFAIVDLKNENVWALFVKPEFEGRGYGKVLHTEMLKWYFLQGKNYLWLSTEKNTRAEKFYLKNGWQPAGNFNDFEIKYELFGLPEKF